MSSKSAAGIGIYDEAEPSSTKHLTANHDLPSMDSAWVRRARLLEPFQGPLRYTSVVYIPSLGRPAYKYSRFANQMRPCLVDRYPEVA